MCVCVRWERTVRGLLMSSEAYEDLLRKAEEGRSFYQGLLGKCSALLQRAKEQSQEREQERLRLLDRYVFMSTQTCVCVCVYVFMSTQTCVCVCVCVCVRVYEYTDVCVS